MHPTPDLLVAFDAGQLRKAEHEAIERHVTGCPDCCRVLERLPEDDLAALIRTAAMRPTPLSDGPQSLDTPTPEETPSEFLGHPRYRLLGRIGSGGMGVVYRALQLPLDRIVALKVLHDRLTGCPGFADRFASEVKTLARLNHPNVVAAFDADQAGDRHFLVMEYVDGESLEALVRRRGPLPPAEACRLVEQAALGLHHAYECGIVHRDVKPGNLLLTRGGTVKVVDFGLSRLVVEAGGGAEAASHALGTPDYMAPEQGREPDSADTRADLYSLGCTLHFLLTGRPPFLAATPLQALLAHQDTPPPPIRESCPDVPPRVAAILGRLLSKRPTDRYTTPAELAAELAAATQPPQPRSLRLPSIGLATIVLVITAAVAVPFGLTSRPPSPEPLPVADALPLRPKQLELAPMPRDAGPDALATTEQKTAQVRHSADQLVGWLRENNVWGPQHAIVQDIAYGVEKHLPRCPNGFLLRLGPGVVKSGQTTFLVARGRVLHQFVLKQEDSVAVGITERGMLFTPIASSPKTFRARLTVELSDLRIDRDDHVTSHQPFTGTVKYRFSSPPRPGGYLRLLYYLPGYQKVVKLIHRPKVPLAAEGELTFDFSPLDTRPFRDEPVTILFADWLTRDGATEVIEGGGAAALIRMRFE
jgi:serine/threonine protein kinase